MAGQHIGKMVRLIFLYATPGFNIIHLEK
jgi:hypothetical protein